MQKDPFLEASRSVALSSQKGFEYLGTYKGRKHMDDNARIGDRHNATLAHSCLTTRQRQSSTGRCTKYHKCARTIYHQLDWAPAPFDRSKSATHLPGDSRAADHEIRPRRWLRLGLPSVRAPGPCWPEWTGPEEPGAPSPSDGADDEGR